MSTGSTTDSRHLYRKDRVHQALSWTGTLRLHSRYSICGETRFRKACACRNERSDGALGSADCEDSQSLDLSGSKFQTSSHLPNSMLSSTVLWLIVLSLESGEQNRPSLVEKFSEHPKSQNMERTSGSVHRVVDGPC